MLADEFWQFLQTTEDVIRVLLVLERIEKAFVRDGGDAHLRSLGCGHAGERVLDHKTTVGGNSELVRCTQVDVGSGLALFDLFAGHNGLEKSGQLVSIQEWSRRRADGARGNGEMQFHAP